MNKDKIKEILKSNVSEERYNHSIKTMEAAEKLANHYDLDTELVSLAALLHDCGKSEKIEDASKSHADIGSEIAKSIYEIEDEKIIHAIKCHTIGCKNMSEVDKVIFLADKIEESRTYEEVEDIRKLAFKDMDEAIYQFMKCNFEYIKKSNKEVFPESEIIFEEFKKRSEQKVVIGKILKAFDDKQGFDFSVIDVSKISSIADYFLICSANSNRQVKAIADEVEDVIDDMDIEILNKDGYKSMKWILIDSGEIVIHIFDNNEREQYNLEELWKQGEFLAAEKFGIEQ